MKDVVVREQLKKLPKIDLHLHLDGSVLPSTLRELAKEQGKELPVEAGSDLTPWMLADESCNSLKEYLSKFAFVEPYLQTPEALERVAYEVVEQSAEQGCRYIEVRFAPLLHIKGGLSLEEAMRHTIHGLRRGERDFGVKARGIAICLRHDAYERNEQVILAAAKLQGDGIAAVDLAGDEASFPPELHRSLFNLAASKGLPITIHAGEAGGAQNVQEAIESLGATRIGHGVRITENPAIMEMVRRTGTPLELCPLSNIQTKAVSGWDAYPIKAFLAAGIQATINTDNLTVSGTTIGLEYELLMQKCGVTLEEIGRLILNSAHAAFLEQDEKRQLIADIEQGLAAAGVKPAV
ncbi:adenosine deaminase [Paenibacillus sp. FSL H8-0537]|uniref:adenosine deaminase n=1 Tax=Paenibacillus sp. FSL H8-0537 TaxID=2921399 RepID=UPI003100EF34